MCHLFLTQPHGGCTHLGAWHCSRWCVKNTWPCVFALLMPKCSQELCFLTGCKCRGRAPTLCRWQVLPGPLTLGTHPSLGEMPNSAFVTGSGFQVQDFLELIPTSEKQYWCCFPFVEYEQRISYRMCVSFVKL